MKPADYVWSPLRYLGAAHAYAHGIAIDVCPCEWGVVNDSRITAQMAEDADIDCGPRHIPRCAYMAERGSESPF